MQYLKIEVPGNTKVIVVRYENNPKGESKSEMQQLLPTETMSIQDEAPDDAFYGALLENLNFIQLRFENGTDVTIELPEKSWTCISIKS